jgi:hypothetical protein
MKGKIVIQNHGQLGSENQHLYRGILYFHILTQ